jgi:hypothetical protein
MQLKSLLIGFAILLGLATTGYALGNKPIENEFLIQLASGPEGGTLAVDKNTVTFSLPGRYVLGVMADDPDSAVMIDGQLEVEVKSGNGPITADYTLALVNGPADSQLQAKHDRVKFNTTGRHQLRLTFSDPNTVTMIDDRLETEVKSDEQIEQEMDAWAALEPDTQVPVEAASAMSALFLPLVIQGNETVTQSAGEVGRTHDHAGAVVTDLITISAADASAVDLFGPFDKTKLPIELQAWWTPAFGHIHVAALLPLGQTVSGKLTIPVRLVMHDNPSVLTELRIDSDEGTVLKIPLGNLRCPQSVCAWAVTATIDTTKMKSGWRELRLRGTADTLDGKRFLASSGIQINVQNGGSVSNYNRFCNNTSLIGRGWYDGFDYTNAIIECVPLAPVKGQVTFRVRAQKESAHLTVDLDKSHFIPAVGSWAAQPATTGATLFDKAGNYSSWVSIPIDTTKLANGWHSLAVKSVSPNGEVSQCSGCPTVKSVPSGVAKFWFYVSN